MYEKIICEHKNEKVEKWFGYVAVLVCADCGEELGEKDYS